MSKSILVIDTPRDCFGCPCYSSGENGVYFCNKENRIISKQDIEKYKPDWCPLRDLPKKKEVRNFCLGKGDYEQKSYQQGFNSCIDEILKGANGND